LRQPVARRPFAGIHAPRSRTLLPTVTLERSEESHVTSMDAPFRPAQRSPHAHHTLNAGRHVGAILCDRPYMQTPRFISTATVSGIANRRRRGNGSDMAVDTRFRYGGGYTGPIWGWTHGADMGVDTRGRYGGGHTVPIWRWTHGSDVGADTQGRRRGGHTVPIWGWTHRADVGADTRGRCGGGYAGPP